MLPIDILRLSSFLLLSTSQAAVWGYAVRVTRLRSLWFGASEESQHVLDGAEPGSSSLTTTPSALRASTGYIAIGDSYSAGIGTGLVGEEDRCRQGQHAYPRLIGADLSASQGPNTSVSLQWLSCTGASTLNLLSGGPSSQIDALNLSSNNNDTTPSPDFATLSIGGNDLGFFDVINACVFRFYSFYSGTCEAALARTDALVKGTEFEERLLVVLLQLLDAVQWEKRPWFVITITGYARFFNAATKECDDASLGVWWGGPKLPRELRRAMNELVLAVNAKLARVVDAVNARFARPKVVFVDYDAAFEGHRFCEPNVMEPDYGREDTWFFLVGGPDNGGNRTIFPNATVRYPEEMLPASSPLVDPQNCLETAQRSGDWGQLAICYMALAKRRDPSLRPAYEQVGSDNYEYYVPTYYGKVFHPRSLGHEVMRDKIYEVWKK